MTEWCGDVPAGLRVERWADVLGGLLLLDSAGRIRACDRKFEKLVAPAAALSEQTIDAIFPVGFRPRELISSLEQGCAKHCAITVGDRIVPVVLQLHPEEAGWLVAIRIVAVEPAWEGPAELRFLYDQLASRGNIAHYLHHTVCQDMIALSLSLACLRRDLSLASDPGFARAIELSDTCSRDLRVLSDSLAPPVVMAEGPNREGCDADASAALEWYVRHLRQDSGIDVRFEAAGFAGGGEQSMNPVSKALICAAVQQWAETAINQTRNCGAPSAATRIHLLCVPARLELEFLSTHSDDPAVAAVLSSALIRECARALGGDLAAVPLHAGSSARLLLPLGAFSGQHVGQPARTPAAI